jgi:hypothetical protein
MAQKYLLSNLSTRSIPAVLVIVSLLGSGQALAQSYPPKKKIHVFGTFSVDGDMLEILRTGRKARPGLVQIRLSSDGTWWKMVRMFDRTGREHRIEQENGGFVSNVSMIEMNTNTLGGTFKVEFWKAKFLGVHTHMHTQTFNTADFDGYNVTLNWREGAGKSDAAKLRQPINESLSIDGKRIRIVSQNNGTKGYVTIAFSTNLAWWTAIKMFDRAGRQILIEKIDGRYKPSNRMIRMPTDSFPSEITIEFWTAKTFGVHTHMSTKKITRERFDGRTVDVSW